MLRESFKQIFKLDLWLSLALLCNLISNKSQIKIARADNIGENVNALRKLDQTVRDETVGSNTADLSDALEAYGCG